jgi:hypothetical protein
VTLRSVKFPSQLAHGTAQTPPQSVAFAHARTGMQSCPAGQGFAGSQVAPVPSMHALHSLRPSHELGRQVTTYWPGGQSVVGPPSDGMRSKHSRDPLKQTLGQGVPAVQVARGSGTQMRPGGQPWPALHETMASLSPASIAALDPSASVAAPFDPRHPERRTIAQPSASRTIGQLVMTPTWVRQKSIGYSTSVDAAT